MCSRHVDIPIKSRIRYQLPVYCVHRFGALQEVIRRYHIEGDEDGAYERLVSGNWARTFLIGKQKGTVTAFKEHVSQCGHVMQLIFVVC